MSQGEEISKMTDTEKTVFKWGFTYGLNACLLL